MTTAGLILAALCVIIGCAALVAYWRWQRELKRLDDIGRAMYPEAWAHLGPTQNKALVRWQGIRKAVIAVTAWVIVLVMTGALFYINATPYLGTIIRFAQTSAPTAAAPSDAPHPPDSFMGRKP